MAREIFISYSRKDLEKVKAIKEEIEKATGAGCWMDLNNIPAGNDYLNRIAEGIERSKVFLFMHSKSSQESKHAIGELAAAYNQRSKTGLIVIIVKIDDCEMNTKFTVRFASENAIIWSDISQKENLICTIKERMTQEQAEELKTIINKAEEECSTLANDLRQKKHELEVATAELSFKLKHLDEQKLQMSAILQGRTGDMSPLGIVQNVVSATKQDVPKSIFTRDFLFELFVRAKVSKNDSISAFVGFALLLVVYTGIMFICFHPNEHWWFIPTLLTIGFYAIVAIIIYFHYQDLYLSLQLTKEQEDEFIEKCKHEEKLLRKTHKIPFLTRIKAEVLLTQKEHEEAKKIKIYREKIMKGNDFEAIITLIFTCFVITIWILF